MKKLLVIVLAVFFANAALAAESRLSGSSASSNSNASSSASSNSSSTTGSSDGWQISAGIHMSKFKVSEPDLLDDAFDHSFGGSKSNTPFSIAIGKEISKNNSGDWLLEFSLMTGEKYEGSLKESYAYTDYWGDTYSESYSIALEVKMTMALFASMYYQFNVPSVAGLKPYLGAGLGLASIKASLSDTYCESDPYYGNDCDSDTLGDASGTNLAYQLALGADYFFNKNVALGLGWGYRNYGSVKIDYGRRNDKVDLSSSGLFGKLTYRF